MPNNSKSVLSSFMTCAQLPRLAMERFQNSKGKKKRDLGRAFDTAIFGSDAKGFAAAASALFARVVKLEPFVQAFSNEIQFGPVDVGQALRIDDHFHAVAFEDRVF